MYNDYSMWPDRHDAKPGNFLDAAKPFGTRFGFNYLPNDFSATLAKSVLEKNEALLTEVAKSSKLEAFQVWLGAVSAGLYDGNEAAAIKAGADYQPVWVFRLYNNFGISKDQAEDLTNANYAYTGYMQTMDMLVGMDFSEQTADLLTRSYLYYFSGEYQYFQDIKTWRFPTVDHTWWGEEVKDVSRLKAGMDYAEFIRLARSVKKLGVNLDERNFGFGDQGYPKSGLGYQLPMQEYEDFKIENEKTLKRWESERDEQKAKFDKLTEDEDEDDEDFSDN
ncbi:hypothetical protein [Mucilaginibacter sp.]|uniref:hypothetical protein n=1 Tax=Mucilaginibacter sp. TaxID=1882438 RepID=UPI0025CC6EBF|nr:hypothetical protein [Mucilaginibacter sp.]